MWKEYLGFWNNKEDGKEGKYGGGIEMTFFQKRVMLKQGARLSKIAKTNHEIQSQTNWSRIFGLTRPDEMKK